jgi:hypothetical protein
MQQGAGLGCLVAAVSSIHATTAIYRWMEAVCEAYPLLGPDGFIVRILAFWYADDEVSLAKIIRSSQLQTDAATFDYKVLQLVMGHDKEGSKTAYVNQGPTRSGWKHDVLSKIRFAAGEKGIDIDLAIASIKDKLNSYMHMYLGNPMGDGLGHAEKQEKAVGTLRSLAYLTVQLAAGIASAGTFAKTMKAITQGVLDTAAAATIFSKKSNNALDIISRKAATRVGHRLANSSKLVSHAAIQDGGAGIAIHEAATRAAATSCFFKVLRGRDGEPSRAAAEARLRTEKMLLGFDVLAPPCPMIDFTPSDKALATHEPGILASATIKSLKLADIFTTPSGVNSQGAAAPLADVQGSNFCGLLLFRVLQSPA